MDDACDLITNPLYAANELHAAVARLERDARLDPPSRSAQRVVHRVVPDGPLKDLLSGTWLGHPLHPMLTDLPIGFWTSVWVLDILGPRKYRDAAVVLVGLGVLSAVPAATAGASDWGDTVGRERRVGLAHAAANGTAAALYLGSWVSRRRGHGTAGIALGMLGAAAATVGGYLGGHLVQGRGVGVDANRGDRGPDEWKRVLAAGELRDQPVRVDAGGAAAVVFRDRDDGLVALSATCPHRGAPMESGTIVDGFIECPWHGSRFRITDGALVRGPAASPLPRFEVRERDGAIEVRAAMVPR